MYHETVQDHFLSLQDWIESESEMGNLGGL